MTIEQNPDKTTLFTVDYDLEPENNPISEDYFEKSVATLAKFILKDARFAKLPRDRRNDLQKLAAACNTLAAVLKTNLTMYGTKDAVTFVLYHRLLDIEEGQLFFLQKIAEKSSSVDIGCSRVYIQNVFLAATFLLDERSFF